MTATKSDRKSESRGYPMQNFTAEIKKLQAQYKAGAIDREKAMEELKALLGRHGLPQDLVMVQRAVKKHLAMEGT